MLFVNTRSVMLCAGVLMSVCMECADHTVNHTAT